MVKYRASVNLPGSPKDFEYILHLPRGNVDCRQPYYSDAPWTVLDLGTPAAWCCLLFGGHALQRGQGVAATANAREICSQKNGEMDYGDLQRILKLHQDNLLSYSLTSARQ